MMREALRDAIRMSRASRWTSLTIVITLALGTGLNAAILALVYGILLRPLPYRDADRLVQIDHDLRLADLEDWTSRFQTLDAAAAFTSTTHVLRGIGPPHVVRAAFVSDNFFDVLAVAAGPAGSVPGVGRDRGVFVSERTTRAAGLAPESMPGQMVSISGLTLPILGVLGADVSFPADGTDLWIPASAAPAVVLKGEDARRFQVVARVKAGVTPGQVAADARRVSEAIDPRTPREKRQPTVVRPLQESLYGSSRPVLTACLWAAGLVLLVACGNVSTLLLGRTAAREQEMAIRLALGAGRLRLVCGLLAEGLLLAVAGSLAGVGLAVLATRAIRTTEASGLPRLDAVAIDWHILVAAFVVSLLVAFACAIAPALFTRRTDAAALVRAHGAHGLAARGRMTSGLVIAQIALSTVLVVAAGLLARSVMKLAAVDLGVNTQAAVALKVMVADTMRLAPERQAFVATLLDRVRSVPGIQHAGVGSSLPPDQGSVTMGIRLVGGSRESFTLMHLVASSPGFLEALGARLVEGRTLEDRDMADAPVVVISRSVARALFAGRDPVGQDMPAKGLGSDPRPPRVIGVVGDVRYDGLDTAAGGSVYMPWSQLPLGVVSLVLRTSGDPRQSVPEVRALLNQLDPGLAIEGVQTLDDLAGRSIAGRRLQFQAACSFALLTLAIALLGLVAALMRSVTERRHELAIRAALGGSPRHIRRLIVRKGAALTAAGLGAGVGGGLIATRLLANALFGVTPYDPLTFGVITSGILAVAVLACLLPATHAGRVNPAEVLRS